MFSITICFLIFLHVKFLPRATGQDLKDEKGHCLSGRQKASIRTCSVHMLFQSIYIYIYCKIIGTFGSLIQLHVYV